MLKICMHRNSVVIGIFRTAQTDFSTEQQQPERQTESDHNTPSREKKRAREAGKCTAVESNAPRVESAVTKLRPNELSAEITKWVNFASTGGGRLWLFKQLGCALTSSDLSILTEKVKRSPS